MPWHPLKTWSKEPLTSSDMNNQVRDNLEHLKEHEVPTGTILPFGGDSAPLGWLICAGEAKSRVDYASLFAVIGTKFGTGDGSTTFNLPDMRGRMPLGKDNMGGTSVNRVTATQADNVGQGAGTEKHTLTVNEMPSHSHAARNWTPDSQSIHNETRYSIQSYKTYYANQYDVPTENTGGGQSHNNMPPYLTLNYIIKT